MEHSFDAGIATKYSMAEAVILKNINFWVEKNKANNKHFYDGEYWTYNSTKAFELLFTYLSKNSIDRAIKSLISNGLIKIGNYNKSSYDRTRWFSVTNLGKCISPKAEMEDTLLVKPIPYINTDDKHNTINSIIGKVYFESETVNSLFLEFIEMRKKLKAVNSNRAIKMLVNILEPFSDDVKMQMIETSIVSSWKNLYPLKADRKVDNEGTDNIFLQILKERSFEE